MKLVVNSSLFIRVVNAALAFARGDELGFIVRQEHLIIFDNQMFFKVPLLECEGVNEGYYSLSIKDLKPISTLKASVVDELSELEFTTEFTFKSGISFLLNFINHNQYCDYNFQLSQDLVYASSEDLKTLSKFLSKFSKDNFKGCFALDNGRFVVPGLYHTTVIPTSIEAESDFGTFELKSTQLNKLLKLNQDICVQDTGVLESNEEVAYFIRLSVQTEALFSSSALAKLSPLFTSELPKLTILQPKLFKDFLKNVKSDDPQYDLCSITTEDSRVALSFYRDKSVSNKFVYTNIVSPKTVLTFYLQTKHLIALSELATEKIELYFRSNFEPVKAVLDEKYVSFIMQGVVV